MKDINIYINEALFRKPVTQKVEYTCKPKNKTELYNIIKERISVEGPECDLNDIDVSGITNMASIFHNMHNINCDISQWDVSNVTNMGGMFFGCTHFNKDISQWDVSNVTNMNSMFNRCNNFNQDISQWDVSNVMYASNVFYECPISKEYKPKF